jgi:MscS family membrane protein
LFEWLAVFVGLPLAYFLLALLNWLASRIAGLMLRRIRKRSLTNPEILPKPVRLLILAAIIRLLLSEFSLPLLARRFWSGVAASLVIAACLWLFLVFNSWAEAYVYRHLQRRDRTGTASILRLGRRISDILSVFAAALVLLYYFGVSPTAALAGLGVGGIAVALAAQKTLENVVGGVSLILDQAVRTGDTLKLGEAVGTVEDVGLRSTRIRTPDRTLLVVPNGQIANMTLETLSFRDKFWFHPSVGLRHQTSPSQIRAIIDGIRLLLTEQPRVDRSSVRVRFVRLGSCSFDLEILAYVDAGNWDGFAEIQESLLFSILDIVHNAGSEIALPSHTTYVASDSFAEKPARPQAAEPARKLGPELAMRKST